MAGREEAVPEEFVGKLPEFLELKKKRNILNEGTAKRNKKTRTEAAGRVILEKLGKVTEASWQGGDEAGIQPAWSWKLHVSHKLFFGGGGVFCAVCGAANSRGRKGKLMGLCTGKLVAGSVWRLAGLMQGSCSAWKTWPDGRPASTRIHMQRVVVGVDQLVADLSKAELKERGGGEIRG